VALLHRPKLLVLDEPTVGVDPLLRARVWTYLRELVAASDTTVIITTHYVEEARHAHTVGMMRHGRLLAEDAPERLLHRFRCSSLEDVFLHLCKSEQEEPAAPRDLSHVDHAHQEAAPFVRADLEAVPIALNRRVHSGARPRPVPVLALGRSRLRLLCRDGSAAAPALALAAAARRLCELCAAHARDCEAACDPGVAQQGLAHLRMRAPLSPLPLSVPVPL
jgi:ABC-type glutathione transport system ATPase component